MELAAEIDPALSCDRARRGGGACVGGFSAPNRVDPTLRRHLSWTVLGKRALEQRGWELGDPTVLSSAEL